MKKSFFIPQSRSWRTNAFTVEASVALTNSSRKFHTVEIESFSVGFNPEELHGLEINEVMEYLYFFDNASLTIRVIEYLQQCRGLSLDIVTVIYLSGGWLVRIKFKERLDPKTATNVRSVMDEFGYACMPSPAMVAALKSLMDGQTPAAVMQRYRIVVITHGPPSREEIETFQQQFILWSGSYPKSLR